MRIRRSLSIVLLAALATLFTVPATVGAADLTPPVFVSSVPADGDTDFTPAEITVTFNEAIAAGPNFANITLVNLSGEEPTEFETPVVSGSTLTFAGICPFYWDVSYILTVPAGAVTDLAGNELASDVVVHFTTRPYTELRLVSLTADPPSRQVAGASVTFTIAAEYDVSVAVIYRFRVMQGREVFYTRDWSPDSTFTWTPTIPGPFKVVGEVMLDGDEVGPEARINYKVTKK